MLSRDDYRRATAIEKLAQLIGDLTVIVEIINPHGELKPSLASIRSDCTEILLDLGSPPAQENGA
jgi:hypothetical protein